MITQLIVLSVGPTVHHAPLWPWWLAVAMMTGLYGSTRLRRNPNPERGRREQRSNSGRTSSGTSIQQLVAYPVNPFATFLDTGTVTAANMQTGLTVQEAGPELTRIVAANQQWAENMGYSPRNNPAHGALRYTKGEL
jgi:hypothetical protein